MGSCKTLYPIWAEIIYFGLICSQHLSRLFACFILKFLLVTLWKRPTPSRGVDIMLCPWGFPVLITPMPNLRSFLLSFFVLELVLLHSLHRKAAALRGGTMGNVYLMMTAVMLFPVVFNWSHQSFAMFLTDRIFHFLLWMWSYGADMHVHK